MTTHPVEISAWPLVVKGPAGYRQTDIIHIKDSGTLPLHVTSSTLHLGGVCGKLNFSPDSFTLQPGQTQVVHASTPSGAVSDYVAIISGTTTGHGIKTGASVGSRIIIGKPKDGTGGLCAAIHTIHKAIPKAPSIPPPPTHFPWTVAGLVAALVLILVLLVLLARRRRHA